MSVVSKKGNIYQKTFPKFINLVRHGISTTFESLPCQGRLDSVELNCSAEPNFDSDKKEEKVRK